MTSNATIIEPPKISGLNNGTNPRGIIPLEIDINEAGEYLTPEEKRQLTSLMQGISYPTMPFREFIPEAWRVVEPSTPFKSNWHIDAISEHLQAVVWGQIPNLIINIPPRHMKSLLVSVMLQPWVWTFRPHSRWLFFSYTKELSTRDNVAAREIIRSEFYQREFGNVFTFAGDVNLKTRFKNNAGGFRLALSVGGSIGEGGDFLIGDDLLAPDDRYSEKKRERSNDFWATTVATRRNSQTTGVIIICQRLHQRDVVGYLEQKAIEGGEFYEKLVIPAEYEGNKYTTGIGWSDPRKTRGDLLWPDRFPRPVIDTLKKQLGGEQTAAQLQQRPSAAGGNIIKKRWLKFWQPRGQTLPPVRLRLADGTEYETMPIVLPGSFHETIQSWDMAFKGTETSSFVCGQVWARFGGDFFFLDQKRDRLEFPATVAAVRSMSKNWPKARAKLVEDKANGPAVIQTLKREISGLIPVPTKTGKVPRAHAVSPVFESGNVYLPHPHIAPWVFEWIEEMSNFPNSPNNDQVDATTQALDRFLNRKIARAR